MLVTIAWWACTTFISLAIGNIIRKTFFTRIQLPGPVQAPWYKRLFLEPDPRQIATWAITVPNKGLIRYHGILNQERILVTSPQGVRDILTTQTYAFQKTEASRTILRSILGDGLVVAEGQAHKLQRKLLQPAFNVRQVKGLYPLFWSKTIELINLLRERRSGDEDINLNDLISRAALDIIGIGGLGLDLENLAGHHSDQFFQAYMQAARPSPTAQKLRFWASILPEYMLNLLPLKRHAELKGASNAVRHLISAAVAKRRQAATSSTDKDILSILLNTGAIEDIDVLSNQGMTFLGGGHDTVSQTMLWAICELSKHPEMQEKLRGEIRTIIPDFSITDTTPPPMIMKILERLETLPLLTAFCNEIFRFYAAIPNLDREALSPVVVNGMKFPKGTTFMISIGGLNRNPQLWQEDPLVFDPTRWLRHGNGGVTTREGFLAFGSGPRACIGEKFGRAEISVLLAGLVGNFEMEWIGDGAPRVAFGGVVRMVEPLAVRFKTLDS